MGHISSKFCKNDSKTCKETESKTTQTSMETTQIEDARSPSDEILRTPIVVEKLKTDVDSQENNVIPLRTKLLKTLKLDPRSPTVGINRTPILVENSLTKKAKIENWDSPISIYSCNLNDSILQDVVTPIEPSVNVSGYERTRDVEEDDISMEETNIMEEERKKSIKILDKPNTYEARRLLDEIMSEEENFLKKVKMPSKKDRKLQNKVADKKINDGKGKVRTPLSNITSCTNSPNQIVPGGKSYNKIKIYTEYGSENSASPKPKHLMQWDQNNTVII